MTNDMLDEANLLCKMYNVGEEQRKMEAKILEFKEKLQIIYCCRT